MQNPVQFPIPTQLHEYTLVEGEANEVEWLLDAFRRVVHGGRLAGLLQHRTQDACMKGFWLFWLLRYVTSYDSSFFPFFSNHRHDFLKRPIIVRKKKVGLVSTSLRD